jgi:putative Holliday junction resolvase
MGLDVGERRIGVAIADELGTIASPLAVVLRRAGDLTEIRDLAAAEGATTLVVGMPTSMSGREGLQAASVRTFTEELRDTVGSDFVIEFWDERLSTTVAERVLRERGGRGRRKERKGDVDAVAAAVILQGYLDAQRARLLRKSNPDNGDAL